MNKLRQINIERDTSGNIIDISFYFVNSEEPFSSNEFPPKSQTRISLDIIKEAIYESDEYIK